MSAVSVSSVFEQVTKPRVQTITKAGLKQFAIILADETSTEEFFKQDSTTVIQFLNSLFHTRGDEARNLLVRALSAPDAVSCFLAHSGNADYVIETLNKLKNDQVTQILSATNAVYGLARYGKNNEVVGFLNKLNNDQITQILSATNAVVGLVINYKANEVIGFLNKLDNNDQITSILSAPEAVWALAWNDKVNDLIQFLNKLDENQITSILSANNAVSGLAAHDRDNKVIEFFNELDENQITSILSAPKAVLRLAFNGYRDWVHQKQAEIAAAKIETSGVQSSTPLSPTP